MVLLNYSKRQNLNYDSDTNCFNCAQEFQHVNRRERPIEIATANSCSTHNVP